VDSFRIGEVWIDQGELIYLDSKVEWYLSTKDEVATVTGDIRIVLGMPGSFFCNGVRIDGNSTTASVWPTSSSLPKRLPK